ncbi:MAG: hypothetical protein A2Z97_16245 [Bdellovibrionales bacterium GWB1_52_6]|nr:MAG: hypothetical protein A2Z97_16245 [Bdellovibrionales bacterium GWB1_52_6]OFZ04542.1 MAG: hypothetical protein A2X97_13035 [Bdellovibrionales bacterium GWA1_52_35]HCM39950.1 hypothetical protein [Bdellovibrionales bacterium]
MTIWLKQAAHALEWNRFLELAKAEAKSEPAKASIEALQSAEEWAASVGSANLRQKETGEISLLLGKQALWSPLEGLTDISSTLERLERGSVLELTEFVAIRRWLYVADSWTQIPRDELPGNLFQKAVTALPDPREPLRVLEKILTPDGELSERASTRLAMIYSEIRSVKREIGQTLDVLLRDLSQKGVLQENYTDVRDGRYVLPVKISAQNEVEGIICEASASRQTVFVEPREVSLLNNRLRQRQNELIQEIFIVLSEASARLKPFTEELGLAAQIMIHWDAVQARAALGLRYSGHTIQVTQERRFYLPDSANPLLWFSLRPEQIVRNTIDFGASIRSFLITGPNTGGKTVLLKCLGLAGLCARTGFPFPASAPPEVPFFDSFFADLGDPQSIEEHLSSFAGHILRFKQILEEVSEHGLVLIDELNTATDPEEGAALGRAFLETVMSRGALLVTTTHDPHLKGMAVSDPRILNASMEFDEESRTPTFQLVLGIPGRSRALETAERLGMPAAVLQLAHSYLSKEHRLFEGMLSKLEKDSHEAARARKDAVTLRDEAAKLRDEWTSRTGRSASELLETTRQKLRRILEQAEDEVRASVRKLDQMRSRREVDSTRAQFDHSLAAASEKIDLALKEEAPEAAAVLEKQQSTRPQYAQPQAKALEIGTTVRVPKWKSTGSILEIRGNNIKVALGNLQITVAPEDIQPLHESETKALAEIRRSEARKRARNDAPAAPAASIDLRGERLDEAMSKLEHYLDQAYRSGSYVEVTVIHGLGTGALREGARALFNSLPYVKAYRDGGPGRGGTGATLVEFERP